MKTGDSPKPIPTDSSLADPDTTSIGPGPDRHPVVERDGPVRNPRPWAGSGSSPRRGTPDRSSPRPPLDLGIGLEQGEHGAELFDLGVRGLELAARPHAAGRAGRSRSGRAGSRALRSPGARPRAPRRSQGCGGSDRTVEFGGDGAAGRTTERSSTTSRLATAPGGRGTGRRRRGRPRSGATGCTSPPGHYGPGRRS